MSKSGFYYGHAIPETAAPFTVEQIKTGEIPFTAPKGERQARSTLRGWLKHGGWPNSYVNTLTKSQFLEILEQHDGTETPAPRAPRATETNGAGQPRLFTETETKTMGKTEKTAQGAAQAISGDAGAQLAALIGQLAGQSVNEDRVKQLIKENAAAPVIQRYELPGDLPPVDIQGAHEKLPEIVDWLAAGVPVYLVGPAGSGKSTIAAQAAQALGREYFEYGAIMTKYDLDNRTTLTGEVIESAFYTWFTCGGVLLLDEMDSAQAAALVQWNNAIRGGAGTRATFSNGETAEKHPDAVVIAAANTVGDGASAQYVGRTRLDKATLDGFVYVTMDYDTKILETLSRGHDQWRAICDAYRMAALANNSQHIISPRAYDFGARLLSGKGETDDALKQAARAVLKKGLDRDQWRNLSTTAARHAQQIDQLDLASL